MKSWYPLREIRRHARHQLQEAIAACDARYGALSVTARAADCDAIDSDLSEIESATWKNVDAAGRSLTCLQSIADHLRYGSDITDADREPDLAAAAMMLRQARVSGAMTAERAAALADELDETAAAGTAFLARYVDELKGLALTLDVAKANQRLGWLRRCQQANPNDDFAGQIRECEMKVAAAKLAFATHKTTWEKS